MVKNRNELADFIRGILIWLMIWGHVIQIGSFDNFDFYQNGVFKMIYSFHMPLFMLISGFYFFYSVENKNTKEVLTKRFHAIAKPAMIWTIVDSIISVILYENFNYLPNSGNYQIIIDSLLYSFWFLWAILLGTMIVILVKRFFNDSLYAYGLIFLLLNLLPTNVISMHVFTLFYYIIGYHIAKKGVNLFNNQIQFKRTLFFLLCFSFLFIFYEKDHYIYTTGLNLFGNDMGQQIYINIYRYVIGIVGSGLFILLITIIYNFFHKRRIVEFLVEAGKNSLYIYAFSVIIMNKLLYIFLPSKISVNPSFFIWVISVLITISFYAIFVIVSRKYLTRKK